MKWHRKQKEHHQKLYLEYRKKELLWYLDIHLSVNHPEWAVKSLLESFTNGVSTIGQLFNEMKPMTGITIPSQHEDLQQVIGFMHYRQYIHVRKNMMFSDIMKLPRVFDLSVYERYALRDKLLKRN